MNEQQIKEHSKKKPAWCIIGIGDGLPVYYGCWANEKEACKDCFWYREHYILAKPYVEEEE